MKYYPEPDAYELSRARFWSNVTLAPASSCWEWRGSIRNGYGSYNNQYAHRLAYRDVKGVVPHGLIVMHSCDNPPCCNPNHLFVGTQAENMRDKILRGRNGIAYLDRDTALSCKLTTAELNELLALLRLGEVSQHALAKRFGVSQPAVSRYAKRLRAGFYA